MHACMHACFGVPTRLTCACNASPPNWQAKSPVRRFSWVLHRRCILIGLASPLMCNTRRHSREPLGSSQQACISRTPFNTQPVSLACLSLHNPCCFQVLNVEPLPPLCCRSWRLAFSRERVSTATFAVRARATAALAASARRFLPAFPDVRHVVLRCGGCGGNGGGGC